MRVCVSVFGEEQSVAELYENVTWQLT